ncbi:notch homolog 2 N-terminal-like protein B [Neocloeon triangulifer]|uniref:notch homolog 2 N-terminal-like protein B n=1 Tax=Neocloeon triangulifer TaxID=2078957 RepID=UPI00286F9E1B|nr:notch homolog 2 N-terminal-like protein B [Neocloeon triangulifer]
MGRPGLLLLLIATVLAVSYACEFKQQGCKIEGSSCICGEGCPGQYRYLTKTHCHRALMKARKGRDVCYRNPCQNGGACVQSSQEPGYKCRCEGTGYFGRRCEMDCTLASNYEGHRYPYECVMI